jgi:hypothetical protein
MSRNEIIKSVEPCLFMRGINARAVSIDYENSKYAFLNLDYLKNYKIDLTTKVTKISTIGKDNMSDTFTKTNMGGQIKIFSTTNAKFFNHFVYGLSENMVCQWCRRQIEDGPIGPVGIPIRLTITEGVYRFDVVSCNCGFRCALAQLNDEMYTPRKIITPESGVLLNTAYSMSVEAPAPKLVPAPDWRLRKANGGSIDDSDFFSETHTYVNSSSVVFCPVKIIYEKIAIKNDNRI